MLLEPIHGVVVSDGFAAMLDVSLTHNRNLFSHCVVVTSPDDVDSQTVAGKHNCELLITKDGRKNGGPFNKGMMIERGLQQLPETGWRVHFDADILFPPNIRNRLGTALHSKACIYGCDRINIVGWDAYRRLIASGWTHRGWEHQHYLSYSIDRAEIGARLIYGDQGWCPLGFFQLWHSSTEYTGFYRTRAYATGSNSAAHDDIQFALRFDRDERILIPEFYVAHLLEGDEKMGKNWYGKANKKFGPNVKSPTPGYRC